ncbi:MAG: hypothetical protein VW522_02885 [Candidatus Neomarinimicrobiota bacterium]|jgi:hypothetical protein
MAKVEKINQPNDNIIITGDSVTFSDLTITNKDLADYLAESDNALKTLESIIEIGVKTMNSLKNSIERDFTKQTFETIAEEMKKNLADSVDDMGDEFNKYFNEDGEFVKELNENKKKMLEELNNELENFVDPSNRESAISKLTEILETEEGKMVDAFEKALNPENSESQIFQLKEKLEKKFTDEIKLLSEDMEKILQELKIDKATTELKEKSTAKGGTHEDFVQQSLSEIAVGDIVERTGEIVGLVPKSKVGDHVVTLNTNSKLSDFKIVFESKSANTYNSSSAITKELTKAMENRGADFGIFVFDSYDRFDKVSSQPFALLSENMALTVLNEDVGNLPLKISYIWAKNILMSADESTAKELSVSYDEIIKSLNSAIKEVKKLSTAKSNNKKAFDAIDANEQLLPEIRKSVEGTLKDLIDVLDDEGTDE